MAQNPVDRGNLIITRYPGEGFAVGDDVVVTIERVNWATRRVHISIQAPRVTKVLRLELVGTNERGRPVRSGHVPLRS